MDVNQGRFLVNGKSGYILKPAYMRDVGTEFDPITLTRGDWLKHKTLHVMVEWWCTLTLLLLLFSPVYEGYFIIWLCRPPVIRSYQPNSSPKWTTRNPPSWTRWWKWRCSGCRLMSMRKRPVRLRTMVSFLSNTTRRHWFCIYSVLYLEVYFPNSSRVWCVREVKKKRLKHKWSMQVKRSPNNSKNGLNMKLIMCNICNTSSYWQLFCLRF